MEKMSFSSLNTTHRKKKTNFQDKHISDWKLQPFLRLKIKYLQYGVTALSFLAIAEYQLILAANYLHFLSFGQL